MVGLRLTLWFWILTDSAIPSCLKISWLHLPRVRIKPKDSINFTKSLYLTFLRLVISCANNARLFISVPNFPHDHYNDNTEFFQFIFLFIHLKSESKATVHWVVSNNSCVVMRSKPEYSPCRLRRHPPLRGRQRKIQSLSLGGETTAKPKPPSWSERREATEGVHRSLLYRFKAELCQNGITWVCTWRQLTQTHFRQLSDKGVSTSLRLRTAFVSLSSLRAWPAI